MADVRVTESTWQRLLHEATGEPSTSRLDAVVALLAEAVGAESAALWDSKPGGQDPTPTLVASFGVVPWPTSASAGSPSSGSVALPVEYPGGWTGTLTLPGTVELGAREYDSLVDLVQMLPELREIIRDRQSLAIVRRCNEILRDAEHEAADEPLTRERLADHFALVCRTIVETLGCAEVSICLRELGADDETCSLAAGWRAPSRSGQPAGRGESNGSPVGTDESGTGFDLIVPISTGAQHWGEIGCRRAAGPVARFTDADLPVLQPVAAQIARSWNSWLQRRAIAAEIASWRQLASAVSRFNRLLAGELKHREPADARVYQQALEIVRAVVPACTGADVRCPERRDSEVPALPVAYASGFSGPAADNGGLRSVGGALAATVYATRLQRTVFNHEMIKTECPDPDATWLVTTPVSVGDRMFGVLDASGVSPTVPSNVAQVCEIVSDQLGLYEHLRQTLQHLRDTRGRLEATMQAQAEALEDLEHQLVSPLLAATSRIERVLKRGRFDPRTVMELSAIRGLCRKSSRVALAAGVFAALSQGRTPAPKPELHSADDLVRLLIAAADDAQQLSDPRRSIEFQVDRESVRSLGRRLVDLDRTFFEQCVGNLLDNAAKYSYANTRVVICGELSDEAYAITVSNTGLTLAPDEAARTLERNWRGTSAQNSSGEGSGLGLWIVDNLMRSMNASVRVIPVAESTTVRLTVPLGRLSQKSRS